MHEDARIGVPKTKFAHFCPGQTFIPATVLLRPNRMKSPKLIFLTNPPNRHKSRVNYWRCRRKTGVTRDRRFGRKSTVLRGLHAPEALRRARTVRQPASALRIELGARALVEWHCGDLAEQESREKLRFSS